MRKVFKSSSLAIEYAGTRTEAIQQAINYLKIVYPAFEREIKRYTWRADDNSGFTITCTPKSNTVYCSHKYNASRKV